MTTPTLVAIIVVAAIVGALATWAIMTRRRRLHLQERFGPEYQRTVDETGEPRRAEALLDRREERVKEYRIRPLTREQGGRFAEEWRRVQARLGDYPEAAVSEADALVIEGDGRARGIR